MIARLSGGPIKVLVVDDSAVVREVFQSLLSKSEDMAVSVASDPIIAIGKIQRSRPDVIVLDLDLPRMDGLSFLRMLMKDDPIPVVVCSALAAGDADSALRALEDGAVDVVKKPRVGVRGFLEESATMLCDAIRGAAGARLSRRTLRPLAAKLTADLFFPQNRVLPRGGLEPLVAIGASTGGPDALQTILEALPPEAPAVAIVQHMPEGFTAAFAKRLNQTCRIAVREARHAERLQPGQAVIAPGGRHMRIHRTGNGYCVEVFDGPLVCRHRPSVDVLFESAAAAAADYGVGVILTGMGADGARGLAEMKRRGAATIAQDEATSVVFGMPNAAIAQGSVQDVVPLPRIASVLLNRVFGRPRPGDRA
jgi:two-component system chemotaxis response regulator CheB